MKEARRPMTRRERMEMAKAQRQLEAIVSHPRLPLPHRTRLLVYHAAESLREHLARAIAIRKPSTRGGGEMPCPPSASGKPCPLSPRHGGKPNNTQQRKTS